MNAQFEFIHDALHALAQPVTALRTALELGLNDHADQPAARKTFADCLGLVDRLTQELAIFREIASLEPEPPLEPCDGEALLKSCVDEMAPVAEACGVALHLDAQRTRIVCNGPMLQRAVFLLLDELIACAPSGGVSIGLKIHAAEAQLEVGPGIPPRQAKKGLAGGPIAPGRRQQLCRKLIEFAGGRSVRFGSDCTHCCFRIVESLQVRDGLTAD